jgi:hypothetical protein
MTCEVLYLFLPALLVGRGESRSGSSKRPHVLACVRDGILIPFESGKRKLVCRLPPACLRSINTSRLDDSWNVGIMTPAAGNAKIQFE